MPKKPPKKRWRKSAVTALINQVRRGGILLCSTPEFFFILFMRAFDVVLITPFPVLCAA